MDPIIDALGLEMASRMVDLAGAEKAASYFLQGKFQILQTNGEVWIVTIVGVAARQPETVIPKERGKGEGAEGKT